MAKLEKIQLDKLISSYGGVGSIIETNTNGSLRILLYNEWPFFRGRDRAINTPEIKDGRLLSYIQAHGYPYVNKIISFPVVDSSQSQYTINEDILNRTIGTRFFPKWFYCAQKGCRRLKKYTQWKEEWKTKFPKDKDGFTKNYPACPFCSSQIDKKGKKYRRIPLQQLRFVMASPINSELKDIPFDKLVFTTPNNNIWTTETDQVSNDLRYKTMQDADGLNAIYIEARDNSNRRIRFSEIEPKYIIDDNDRVAYKMFLRGSNSIYSPNIVRSLYMPIDYKTDLDMDIQEFRYLTNEESFKNGRIVEVDLYVDKTSHHSGSIIKNLYILEKLKETSVLLSFTRVGTKGEPLKWYNPTTDMEENNPPEIRKPFDDRTSKNLTYMPGVEAYGEGLLFEIPPFDNIETDKYKIFLHTFCHIIMKELEFECGYPLTSLHEKIYVDTNRDKSNGGFLIYTIAGSEGSFGGLVSLAQSGKIYNLIDNAVERAKHCTNDPICIEEEAHCFACVDIPETSCAEFNNNLDRKLFLNYYDKALNLIRGPVNPVPKDKNTNEVQKADNKQDEIVPNVKLD